MIHTMSLRAESIVKHTLNVSCTKITTMSSITRPHWIDDKRKYMTFCRQSTLYTSIYLFFLNFYSLNITVSYTIISIHRKAVISIRIDMTNTNPHTIIIGVRIPNTDQSE